MQEETPPTFCLELDGQYVFLIQIKYNHAYLFKSQLFSTLTYDIANVSLLISFHLCTKTLAVKGELLYPLVSAYLLLYTTNNLDDLVLKSLPISYKLIFFF